MTLYREWLKKIQENENQKAAFEKSGHTVVIAGPGSGKTRVLAIKIAKLLRDQIPYPKGVACLTYTRMMAKELENRLSSLNVLNRPNIVIGTVHSFCLQQIVNPFSEIFELDIPRPIKIAPQKMWDDCLNSARKNIAGLEFDPTNSKDKEFKTELTKYHKQKIDIPYEQWGNQSFAKIIQFFYANLYSQGYIDFDMVVKSALSLLAKHDLVRQSLYTKFEWLAVDEYQDLGYPLFRIVDLLIENTPIKLFAIGDPNQSIFDFAGTDPKYLLELAERPYLQPVIKLNKNYRSTTEIIQVSKAILSPYCEYDSEKSGGKVRVYEENLYEQAQLAAKLVNKYLNLGVEANRIAILHPWRDKDGVEGINVMAQHLIDVQHVFDKNPHYDRSMMLISWLEDLAFWCLDGFNTLLEKNINRSFDDLVSTWWKIIHPQSDTEVESTARLILINFAWSIRKPDLPFWMWLDEVSSKLLLDSQLKQYELIFPDEVMEYNNLRKMVQPGYELEAMTLRKFLDMTQGVQLTTIHSSKGMEFEVVICAGIEKIWDNPNGRRLLYVAITRAEKDVCLIYSKIRPKWNPATPPHILNLINKCQHFPFVKHFPRQKNS